MLLSLKRSVVIDLFTRINNFIEVGKTEKFHKYFVYALRSNYDKLKPEIDAIFEAKLPSDEYKAYENSKIQIGEKYCERTENGSAVIDSNGLYVFDEEKKKLVSKEITKLNELNEEVLNIRKKEIKEFNDLIDEVVDVEVTKISYKYFPETIDIFSENALKILVNETEAQLEKMLLE